MKIKKANTVLIFSLSILLFPVLLSSQVITYVDTAFSIFIPKTIFGEIKINTCSDSLVEEETLVNFCHDIMVQSNGDIYGFGPLNGFIYDTILFLSFNEPKPIYYNSQGNYFSHDIRGLTCDENGVAYSAGRGISRRDPGCCGINPNSGGCCTKWEEIYLGTLPPNMQCLGDLTYRKGKFYLSAIGNKLVEVNIKNPSQSKIIYDFPSGTLPIHGLTTVQFSCDSVKTYAIGRAWDHSIVYELDFDNWALKQVCDMPALAIDGAGNITECALPPCNLFVDLDGDNSSLGFLGNYCADTFCITTPISVADTDVVVLSAAGFIDSITLQLTSTLDGALEFLSVSSLMPTIQVSGNGTSMLSIVNNGASIGDFEDALKFVAYMNNAPIPSSGIRRVLVLAWAGGEASHVSVTELPLFFPCDTLSDAVHNAGQALYSDLKLQPNPAKDYFIADISLSNYSEGMELSLTMTDAFGNIILKQDVPPDTSFARIDINDLAAGLYFVYLYSGGRLLVVRKMVLAQK